MAAHKSDTQAEHRSRANGMLKGAGYSGGGKMTPAKAVHKHEGHMHPGKTPTKLAAGGKVHGPKEVNVVIHTGEGDAKKLGMQQGMQLGAKMAAGAPKPPMAPPPPGMHPGMPPAPGGAPGQMAMRPPGAGPMKKGGIVKVRAHERAKGGRCE